MKSKYLEFRNNALSNRTRGEIWANDNLLKHFTTDSFIAEYIFNNRRFDFYFPDIKTALEIDGGYHYTKDQWNYDKEMDRYLLYNFNIKVLRVNNFDISALNKRIDEIKSMYRVRKTITKKKSLNYLAKKKPKKKVNIFKERPISSKSKDSPHKLFKSGLDKRVHKSLHFKNKEDREKFMKQQLERALKK